MKKRNYFSDIEDRNENAFSVIADFEGNEEQLMDIEVDEILPVLPLRNMVLFPGVFMPVSVGRKSSLKLVREAEKKSSYIAVVCQKAADTEEPVLEESVRLPRLSVYWKCRIRQRLLFCKVPNALS